MVHTNICKKYKQEVVEPQIGKLIENEEAKGIWDCRIQIEKLPPHNTLDLTIVDKKDRTKKSR